MAISAGGSVTAVLAATTDPQVGSVSPDRHCSRVVLPAPEGPTMQRNSPDADGEVDVPEDLVVAVGFAEVVDHQQFVAGTGRPVGRSAVMGVVIVRLLGVFLVVPVEDPGLDQAESEIEQVAQHAEHHDARPHVQDFEGALGVEDEVADAAGGCRSSR